MQAQTQDCSASFDERRPATLGAVTAADVASAQAALDAAGDVFRRVGVAVDDATPSTSALRAQALWHAAESVLKAVTLRDDLRDQALIREASNQGRLSLAGAHALVALRSWTTSTMAKSPADVLDDREPSGVERTQAADAWRALAAAVGIRGGAEVRGVSDAPPSRSAPTPAVVTSSPRDTGLAETPGISAPSRTSASPRARVVIASMLGLLIVAAGTSWYAVTLLRRPTALAEGIDAYERGARETARIAFVRAVREHPEDVTPLVFLGRIAREERNLPASRRFLDAAVRRAPSNAVAVRELASSLLASGDAEVARRFYVRALQLDPTDRVAQGFLGCALFRLGRTDEAMRWTDRAGNGDWSDCVHPSPSHATTPPASTPTIPRR